MRPLQVVLQAFGPYAGRQVLDFTRLPKDALFLVHGSTGAGKTTVLDAICFALYGEASGDERDSRGLRSDHAAADTLTEVVLDFSLGADLYRVRRLPTQQRPKKSGKGETTQNADATLWRLEATALDESRSEIEVLANGVRDVNRAIVQRLGFEGDQFRQVVLLPQGRFRDLLTAGSDQREAILQTLFATGRYKRIEQALKMRAATLRKALEHEHTRLSAKVEEAAQLLEPAEAPGETESLDSTRLGERVRLLDVDLLSLKETEQAARKRENKARTALERAKQVRARLDEAATAGEALRTLEAKQPLVLESRSALEAARRALPLQEVERSLRRAQATCAEAETRLLVATTDEAAASRAKEEGRVTLAALLGPEAVAEREAAAAEHHRLRELEPALEELKAAQALSNKAERRAREAVLQEQDRKKDLRDARAALETCLEALATSRQLALPLDALDQGVQQATTQLTQRRQLDDLRTELATVRAQEQAGLKALETLQAQHQAAREAHNATRACWDGAQAVILARNLEAALPCPVCGSTIHPAPASATSEPPTQEELDKAEARTAHFERDALGARVAHGDWKTASARAEEKLSSLEKTLGPAAALGLAQLAKAAEEAERRRKEAAEAGAQASALEPQGTTRKAALGRAEQAVQEAETEARLASPARAEAAQALKGCELRLEEGLRTPDALAAAIRAAAHLQTTRQRALEQARTQAQQSEQLSAVRLEAVRSARELRISATKLAEECRATFAAALGKAGFDNAEACSAAHLPEERIKTLQERLRAFDESLAAARDRSKRAGREAQDLVPPDLEALLSCLEEDEQATRDIQRRGDTLEDRLKTLRRIARELGEMEQETRAKEAQHGWVATLSKAADGHNPKRLSFQRFVLAALLDEVLEVASRRLLEMTRGRYRLRRRDVPANLVKAGGLELDVHDDWTGHERSASTLSGGESFLAALALALAMADVVQQHAGGVRLDTLFVDEGFGSLDEESLDLAVNTLVSLREGGRMVGIISHVAGLRERIDVRLEVSTGPEGSCARFILP